MEFKELLDWAKSEAIANTLQSTEISVWREICRKYSEKFSTALHLCLDGTIDPQDIMLAHFESQLDEFDEEKDLEAVLDQIYTIEDPDYEKEKSKELDSFVKKAEKDEEERLRLGKPIHKAMKKSNEVSLPKNPDEKTPKRTGGSINLSYLAKEENQFGEFGE